MWLGMCLRLLGYLGEYNRCGGCCNAVGGGCLRAYGGLWGIFDNIEE